MTKWGVRMKCGGSMERGGSMESSEEGWTARRKIERGGGRRGRDRIDGRGRVERGG